MLTLSSDPKKKDTKLIDVISKSQKRRRTHENTVYFTHELDTKNSNVSEAAGVLEMHKEHLKKQTHISEHEFAEIAQMLDDEEEPDMHHPLKPGRTSTGTCSARCTSGTTPRACSS